MNRRAFIEVFAAGLVMAGSVAEAQPAVKVYRVGILLGATAETVAPLVRALTEGLRDLGYVEGRNIVFERRYADGRLERLPDLGAELVRFKCPRRSRKTRDRDDSHRHGRRGGPRRSRVHRESGAARRKHHRLEC